MLILNEIVNSRTQNVTLLDKVFVNIIWIWIDNLKTLMYFVSTFIKQMPRCIKTDNCNIMPN